MINASIVKTITDSVTAMWSIANGKNDAIVERVLGAKIDDVPKAVQRRYFSTNEKALAAFIDRKVEGLNLSDRVWKYTDQFKEEIEMALDLGIREGKSAAAMSLDVRQYLQSPDMLFRRVRDEHGLLQLSQRAKAYHPGQGVYRSSYKNARRLTATETNIAYRTADFLRYQQMDFVVGIQICLSNNHTVLLQPGETTSDPEQLRADGSPKANAVKHLVDICDELQGRYPKDFKFTGWHPHCRCHVITILKSKDEIKQDLKRLANGEDVENTSVNEVTELPPNFEAWIKNNKARIKNRPTLPYFIKDNQRQVNGILGIKHYLCESKLDNSIKKIRKSLVRQDREIMYVLNSKGQIILTIKGGKLSVEFEDETSKILENTIITHNHPTGKGINGISQFGYSLSSQDVYEAISCNVKQMIAETQYYRYTIERPEGGWRINANEVKKRYAEIYKEIAKKYEKSIMAHRALNYIQHIVMKQLAKEFEFIYRYENLKKN